MKNDVVIKVEKLSKKYQIGARESYLTLRDRLVELPKTIFKKEKKKEFWALKNVSFEIKRGEVVGVIGRNGAGKSTLLKILARITEPTSGKITMKGRVASMLEVGTGFNPELTGRENIYLNGSILGMSRAEIESKFKEIVEFSGVEKFIDTPVKHYSSGMYVRLAFAVAAHLDSDILLVDEVLAVGDIEFQKKCLGKMSKLSKSGKTILYVSHDISSLINLTSKSLLLVSGSIVLYDNTKKVAEYYSNTRVPTNSSHVNHNSVLRKIIGSQCFTTENKKQNIFRICDGINISVIVHNMEEVREPAVGILIKDFYGSVVFSTNTQMFPSSQCNLIITNARQEVVFQLREVNIANGKYTLDISITEGKAGSQRRIDYLEAATSFEIISHDYFKTGYLFTSDYGKVLLKGSWRNK